MSIALPPTPAYTGRRTDADRIVDLFGFAGLGNLADPLSNAREQLSARGRRSPYPDTCLLAVDASARITGSLTSATRLLGDDPALWDRCRRAFFTIHAQWLPATPPDRHAVRQLRDKVTGGKPNDERGPLLPELLAAFREASVRQAQALGNLLPGSDPDWATPDYRHTVFGDGTIVKPFSDVALITHPVTGEPVYLGSRASTGAVRIQRTNRSPEDKKPERGINFVSLQTRTDAGRVVLAVDSELGAEAWTALTLIDSVAAAAGDGVHSVVYDRALNGWHVDYLMARHRIQVLGKAIARKRDDDAKDFDAMIVQRMLRAVADGTPEGMDSDPSAFLKGATEPVLRRDVLSDIARGHHPQVVGTSVYPTSRGFDVVHGTFHFLQASHTTTDGMPCEHDLVMDDGALYTCVVDPFSERLVKAAHLSCVRSVPVKGPNGAWGRTSTYRVPCGDDDFDHEIAWLTEGTRYGRESPEKDRAPDDPIGHRLHPITRADADAFEFVFQARNDAESYNAWFKRSLPGKARERAASITHEGQLYDFLLAAVVNNSDTWAASQR